MNRIDSISGIRYYLGKYGIHPRKKWGQNFLLDGNILRKIALSCNPGSENLLVEIGPGLGALTKELAAISRGVLAIEIDSSLREPLAESLHGLKNTYLKFADVLQIDLEEELRKAFGLQEISGYKVCANIPYNITTPIIFKLLETCPHMESATLMMQKEVARRILASPGSKEYGLLTLTTAYYADVKYMMPVSRNCFFPRPEVDSSVIQLLPIRGKRVQVKDELSFKKLLRVSFQKRRKTILNICADFFAREKPEIHSILTAIGIDPRSRPENLAIEQFARISNILGN
ncbi:MAG: 16S rRNA (adenine(1518)-N(6)/adenine(1519)-N(6))-dimethyltransferase RsmA [Syntrophomonas sp.]|uniref:16S rRNA (adenine(1518)-N(6)/adenine(1519)-N(6))- dimethyltransferase RsmA n=1 Tax=Syntrophomonas sp. TaxID=2053627 RepID=UPI0026399C88|nr:16S rRNA (adenine(1518)-N(6)/adenine(1519)-N(6))-dimethyltransferase RsmA [Syntrophomonas sp.]MDD2510537.1 16S rRNA (adenine(1518)-N(6)/adenine(1519)-N(6))-dimethyltransferase RsmA [Syntrophomonas sp.]MDD3879962.1 16S rRNA (adenine(1518)-N(6)/adenine(1519)-N(6))-dimethyltransferase RsmA [Syntrophomonas sp.]MDD4626358.1 16S rRNA (adenine(1518)-N(6)/adenine(1519)-N(6))-dimethyltransferase RsmA [Syntrophomonas sp.]